MSYLALDSQYPGLIGQGPTTPKAPNPKGVGQDYLGLLKGYAAGQSDIFGAEQEYKPKYIGENVSNLNRFGPQAVSAVRGMDPGQARLFQQYQDTASSELALGRKLDSTTAVQNLRGAQAARGLGHGPSDAMYESRLLTDLGNQMLQQRLNNAQTGFQMGQQYDAPAMGMVANAGPTIMPPASTYDMFNTAYNAKAGAKIASANAQTAADSFDY